MSLPKSALRDLIKPGYGFKVLEDISAYDADWWNGRLVMWDTPELHASYTIGVDVAEGVGRDRSVIQVLRRGDLKRPDEQVAEFASDYHDPLDLNGIINAIGRFYRDDDGLEALVIIEENGLGNGMSLDLSTRLDYANLFRWKVYDRITNTTTNRLGWWTNRTTRPKLIAKGKYAIIHGDLLMNSVELFKEWKWFQPDHYMARAAAASNRHDDRVMALLMAHWAAHDDEWLSGEDVAEQRRLLTAAGEVLQTKEEKVGRKADWQNRAISYDQMIAEADEAILEDFSVF